MQTSIFNNIMFYLLIGTLWGALVEFIESKQTQRQIPRTITARIIVVLTWPLALFGMLVGIIRSILNG